MNTDICPKHKIPMGQPDCNHCDEFNEVEDDLGGVEQRVTCHYCKGTGLLPWTECDLCNEEALDDIICSSEY